MQNDTILHSTLIASFIQEYASPLQTIIKPPSPHDAPLSCLYREGWSESRRVSLPKSEDWMTELRRNPVRASASESRRSHSSLPVERHLEIQRSPPLSIILGTHCSLCLSISWLLTYHCTPKNHPLHRHLESIRRPSGSTPLSLHSQCLLRWLRESCTIKLRQWATWVLGCAFILHWT